MLFTKGRMPAFSVAVVNAVLVVAAHAQTNLPLTLAEAERLALDNEPGQAAMLARADAFEERAVAAGQLPEPMLRVGLNNYPIESGGFSTEGMTHALVGFRQAFPPGKSRSIASQRNLSIAEEISLGAEARGREVLSSARTAWLEVFYWQRAHKFVSEARPFFEDLAAVTRSLYAVGRKNQQDVLRAELELSRLDDRLIEVSRRQDFARAELGRWVGDAASRPMADQLPDWGRPPSRSELLNELQSHPVLRAADARVAAEDAGVNLADQQKKPAWALDLGYSYREGMLPNGDPRSDFVSLSVTVGLPFLGGKSRQDRNLAAALSERRAAVSSREQLSRQLRSRLEAAYSRWEQVEMRLALYEQRIMPQTDEQAQAALAAYQRDRGDFADVMRGYIDDLNARLDYTRLQVERAQSYTALADLGGLSQ